MTVQQLIEKLQSLDPEMPTGVMTNQNEDKLVAKDIELHIIAVDNPLEESEEQKICMIYGKF